MALGQRNKYTCLSSTISTGGPEPEAGHQTDSWERPELPERSLWCFGEDAEASRGRVCPPEEPSARPRLLLHPAGGWGGGGTSSLLAGACLGPGVEVQTPNPTHVPCPEDFWVLPVM